MLIYVAECRASEKSHSSPILIIIVSIIVSRVCQWKKKSCCCFRIRIPQDPAVLQFSSARKNPNLATDISRRRRITSQNICSAAGRGRECITSILLHKQYRGDSRKSLFCPSPSCLTRPCWMYRIYVKKLHTAVI